MTYKNFQHSEKGTINIIACLCLPVLLLFSMGAMDYGYAVRHKNQLASAADAAALAGVNEAYIAYINKEDVNYKELIEEAAKKAFEVEAKRLTNSYVPTFTAVGSVINNTLKVEVTYSAKYKPLMLEGFGVGSFPISGKSRAITSTAAYINVNLIFDVSHSMAIGADDANQRLMIDTVGCAFACHMGGHENTSYKRAQRAGATMRIDVARDGAVTALDAMERMLSLDEQVTFTVHEFDNLVHEIVGVDHDRGSDFSYIKQQINDNIQLTPNYGGTNIEKAIQTVTAKVPMGGSGLTPDDRVQYFIVLTDGVESTQALIPGQGWRQHSDAVLNTPYKRHAHHEVNYSLNASVCDTLKENNAIIYFIHTPYDKPYGGFRGHDQNRFNFIRDTLSYEITDRFESCAGDSKYVIEASTPAEIKQTFEEVLAEIATPLRLQ
ncbi:MAG: pilus assembly protein TadG-related protein [Aquisalinus sp.]|nr:pilus assembly protein TadG-related protein [Aquisalinus sp.]